MKSFGPHVFDPLPEGIPGDARSFVDRGTIALRKRDWKEAKAAWEAAVAIDPTCGEAWAGLSTLAASRDVQEAIRHHGRAIENGHDRSQMRISRGYLSVLVGDLHGALADFDWVIAHAPARSASVLALRGLLRLLVQDPRGAIADLDEALRWQHHAVLPGSALCAGMARWITGDFGEAAAELSRRFEPGAGPSELNVVWRYLSLLRCGVADEVAGRAMRGVPPLSVAPEAVTGSTYIPESDVAAGTVTVGRLFLELFTGRIPPDRLLAITRAPLAHSQGWRRPNGKMPAGQHEWQPNPDFVWRSEVMLLLGMWHLCRGDRDAAAQRLAEAACPGEWETLERQVAIAELARLNAPHTARSQASEASFNPLSRKLLNFLRAGPIHSAAPQLKVLDFYGEGIGDDGLAQLIPSPRLHQLEQLKLELNGLTERCAASLRVPGQPTALQSLQIQGNQIGDEGFLAIVLGPRFPKLTSLDISGNGVSDEALMKFLTHTRPSSLERLVLGTAPVDMRVWWLLAARLGEGLYASADFKHPYEPPFDPDKLVCFSYKTTLLMTAELRFAFDDDTLSPAPGNEFHLFFRLADYTRELWLRNTQLHRIGRGPTLLSTNVDSVRRVEALGLQPSAVVMQQDDWAGLGLVLQGMKPLTFECGQCGQTYSGELLRVETKSEDSSWHERLVCPAGHLLYQTTSLLT